LVRRFLSNHGQRISNILPGKFWRFVELQESAKKVRSSLGEVAMLKKKITRLHAKIEGLKSYDGFNEVRSDRLKIHFLKSLEEFRSTG
ncbi:hypothetical protein, partial [Pseudomonas putida]|uniref:hypothetical protein n=1 Tax=Pseudomonas putida TaxID=303 RepID=UPI000A23A660